jgi:hypothetical protein
MSDISHDATFAGFVAEIQSDIAPLFEFCRFTLNDGDAEHIDIGQRVRELFAAPTGAGRVHILTEYDEKSSYPGCWVVMSFAKQLRKQREILNKSSPSSRGADRARRFAEEDGRSC